MFHVEPAALFIENQFPKKFRIVCKGKYLNTRYSVIECPDGGFLFSVGTYVSPYKVLKFNACILDAKQWIRARVDGINNSSQLKF